MSVIFGFKIIHFTQNLLQNRSFPFHTCNCDRIKFINCFHIQIHIKLQQIFNIFYKFFFFKQKNQRKKLEIPFANPYKRGVSPSLFTLLSSQPFFIKFIMIVLFLLTHTIALCKGVLPSKSCRFKFMDRFINMTAISLSPLSQAQCKGVSLFLFGKDTL